MRLMCALHVIWQMSRRYSNSRQTLSSMSCVTFPIGGTGVRLPTRRGPTTLAWGGPGVPKWTPARSMGWSCSGHKQHLLHLGILVTRPDSVWFLPVGFCQAQCLHPTTSKDTTRIAGAHQHCNREHHTRHAWEGLAEMGVSPGHLPCHTRGAHRMHLRSLYNCKHPSFKW